MTMTMSSGPLSATIMFLATFCAMCIGAATADRFQSAWTNLPRPTAKHGGVWSGSGGSHSYNPFSAARRCGKKVCRADGVCKWSGCGDCETCLWGKCVEQQCPPCHSCDGWECKSDCSANEHCVHDHRRGKHKCVAKPPPPQPCTINGDCTEEFPNCEDGYCVGAQSCKGKPGKGLEEDGACPAATCFNDPNVGQKILSQGSQGSDWVIGVNQCLQDGKISFITWAPAVNGQCVSPPPDCGSNKAYKVPHGATFVDDLIIPFGECTGEPICVYVHDGAYRKGAGGVPQPDIPDTCYSKDKHLCKMCGPYLVTPQLPASKPCSDPFTCTTGDTCGADGVCMGNPVDSICNDGFACTDDVCVADQDLEAVGVLEVDAREDGSGCGYKATTSPADTCDDGFACTDDLCVALPSVLEIAPDGTPGVGSGCFSDKQDDACDAPKCAVAQCSADATMMAGDGCTVMERMTGGQGFCAAKYGSCAGAVCDIDGTRFRGQDEDGCVLVGSDDDANERCPNPGGTNECGVGKCARSPRAAGDAPDGCVVEGRIVLPGQCDGGATCESATCSDDGLCQYTPNDDMCDDDTACTKDICVGSGSPAAFGVMAADVLSDGCAYKKEDDICRIAYDSCAGATCEPQGDGADGNGCVTAHPTDAASACLHLQPECGSVTCNLWPLTAGGTGPLGDGCTVHPNDDDCKAGRKPCEQPTCTPAGTCATATVDQQDTFCQQNFLKDSDCVIKTCDPDTASDPSGCLATTTDPDPCTVKDGFCGTSTCNIESGKCEEKSMKCVGCSACVGGQCRGPDNCPDGQCCKRGADDEVPNCSSSCPMPEECTPACTGCQTCDTSGAEPTCVDSTVETTYDMVCYKCGNAISCAVKDVSSVLTDDQLSAIQAELAEICSTGKTCQNQNCGNGATVYGSTCFPLNDIGGTCPCVKNDISNYAGYKVTIKGGATCSVEVSCPVDGDTSTTVVANGKCDAGTAAQCSTSDFGEQDCDVPGVDAAECIDTV